MKPNITSTSATQRIVTSAAGDFTTPGYSAAAPEIWCATSLA
jgi:hypothetical protein